MHILSAYLILFTTCISFTSIAFAQSHEIENYMACTLANSQKFMAANAQLQSLKYKYKVAYGSMLPSFKYDYTNTNSNNYTKYGDADPVKRKYKSDIQTYRMDLPIFNPLKSFEYLQATTEYKKAIYEVENTKYDELFDSLSIFFEFIFLNDKINLIKKHLLLSKNLNEIATHQFKLGTLNRDDLYEFELLVDEFNAQAMNADETFKNLKIAQSKFCEHSPSLNINNINHEFLLLVKNFTPNDYEEIILNRNSNIQSSKLAIKQVEYDLKKASVEFIPTSNIFVSKNRQFDGKNILIGSDNSTLNNSVQVGVQVHVPLFEGFSSYHRVKQGIESIRVYEKNHALLVQSIFEKLNISINTINSKIDYIKILHKQINIKNKLLNSTTKKIHLGLKESVELVYQMQKIFALEVEKNNAEKEILLNYLKLNILLNNHSLYEDQFLIDTFKVQP